MQNVLSVWWQRLMKEASGKRAVGWAQRGPAMVWVCNVLQDHGWWQCWEVVQPSRVGPRGKKKGYWECTLERGAGRDILFSQTPRSEQLLLHPALPTLCSTCYKSREQGHPIRSDPEIMSQKNLPFQFLPWVFCHNRQKLTQNPKNLWRHCEQKPNSIGIAITTHPPDKINTCEWTVTRMNKWIHGLIQGVGGTVLHYRIPKVNA